MHLKIKFFEIARFETLFNLNNLDLIIFRAILRENKKDFMSFAIIETGGKQYKVSASKILEIEKLKVKVGETIKFKNVLLLNDDKNTEIGNPNIEGAL